MRRSLRPNHALWLLGHIIIFLIGIIIITVAPFDGWFPGASIGIGSSLVASGIGGYVLYLYVFFGNYHLDIARPNP